jgi:hypothetical protein
VVTGVAYWLLTDIAFEARQSRPWPRRAAGVARSVVLLPLGLLADAAVGLSYPARVAWAALRG